MIVCTGCNLLKGDSKPTPPPTTTRPGTYDKLLLKVKGPASAEEGEKLRNGLLQLSFVDDVSINIRFTGTVLIDIVPGTAYDIVQVQKAAKNAGYEVLRAAKITW